MIWLSFLCLSLIYGQTLDQVEIKKIFSAKTAEQVARIRKVAEEVRIERLACRIQLQESLIPESCYRALALESRFGLRTNASPRAKLDRHCIEASQKLKKPSNADLHILSPLCREAVHKAHELLAYKLESE